MKEVEFIRVEEVQVFTLRGSDRENQMPFLRFLLENGSDFMMSNIPMEIAISLSVYLSKTKVNDSRLKIHDLVSQLAIVEKVEIDSLVPGTGVYQATITLTPEGFSNFLHFPMIPSNATLLAVLNQAPIFVSERLWREYIKTAKIHIDDDLAENDEGLSDFR